MEADLESDWQRQWHSSTLAWKIPRTEEPGGLQSMGSQRVGHDWVTSLSLFTFMHWRRKWQPTPVFLPGESQGRQSLVGCRLWGRTRLKRLSSSCSLSQTEVLRLLLVLRVPLELSVLNDPFLGEIKTTVSAGYPLSNLQGQAVFLKLFKIISYCKKYIFYCDPVLPHVWLKQKFHSFPYYTQIFSSLWFLVVNMGHELLHWLYDPLIGCRLHFETP